MKIKKRKLILQISSIILRSIHFKDGNIYRFIIFSGLPFEGIRILFTASATALPA